MFVIAFAAAANADVVFSNFGPLDAFGDSGRLLQGPDVGTIGDVNQAAAFSVGPTGFYLTGVDLGINCGGPGVNTGPINVVVAADAGGSPGAALRTTLVDVTLQGKQVISAAYDGSLPLTANTQYWVIADAEGTFDGGWNFNSIGDVGLTAGQTEGLAWNLRSDDTRYAFRVEGRPVPEAATVALLAAIGLSLATIRGRRR
jgi:hypothetical protein